MGRPLYIPGNYKTLSPVLGEKVRTDPLRALKSTRPSEGTNSPASEITRCIADLHERFRAITLVAGGKSKPSKSAILHQSAIRKRVGTDPYFVINEGGTNLLAADPLTDNVRLVGGLDDADLAINRKRERIGGVVGERGLATLPSFVRCPAGGMILATGAAVGRENGILREHAQAAGGTLICHDVTPSVLHAAQKDPRLRGVPYAILPPHPDFLVPLLHSHPGPRIMAGTNVLSVFTPEDADNLLETAEKGNVGRIVFFQQNAFARDTPLLPEEFCLGHSAFVRSFESLLDSDVAAGRLSETEIKEHIRLIPHQARMTVEAICWEALRTYLIQYGQRKGFTVATTVLLENEEELQPSQARAHVNDFSPPDLPLQTAFAHGHFNQICCGPFGDRISHDPGIAEGALRRTNMSMAIVLEREENPAHAVDALRADRVTEIAPDGCAVPPEWRFTDRRFSFQAPYTPGVCAAFARITHQVLFRHVSNTAKDSILHKNRWEGDLLQQLSDRLLRELCTEPPPEPPIGSGTQTA